MVTKLELKELASLLNESIVLRGLIDSLDDKMDVLNAEISANKVKISELQSLSVLNDKLKEERKSLEMERNNKQGELNARLQTLEDNEVKLPIKDKLVTKRTKL